MLIAYIITILFYPQKWGILSPYMRVVGKKLHTLNPKNYVCKFLHSGGN